jgi:hypothetical protein
MTVGIYIAVGIAALVLIGILSWLLDREGVEPIWPPRPK